MAIFVQNWFFLLSDCSLNEDNFSLRCPKHKVKKERLVFMLFLGKFISKFCCCCLYVCYCFFFHPINDWAFFNLIFLHFFFLSSFFCLSFFYSSSPLLLSPPFFTQFTQSIRPAKSIYLEQSERGWTQRRRRRDAGVWEL